jgi:phage repressor protein C with HTH and peptisase S24 domain
MSAITERASAATLCEIADMAKDAVPDLYERLMAIRPEGLTANAWLIRAGVNRSFFSDLRKRGRARSDIVDKVIEAAGLTPAQFYAGESAATIESAPASDTRESRTPFRSQGEVRDIPLLGTALGGTFKVGDDGEPVVVELTDVDLDNVVDYLRRPANFAGRDGIYAITQIGSSMEKWSRDGDPWYVHSKQQPSIGDHVVVQIVKRDLNGEGRIVSALVKELVKRSSEYVELEQYNPPLRFRVPTRSIASIHRIIPYREIVFF